MNLPNMLTVSRLFLAAFMMACLTLPYPFMKSAALFIFVIAGISDFLDGHLARNVYGVTSFGKLMDPLTDKVIVCAAFVSFTELGLVPAWITVIIISREFLVTGLRLLAVSKGDIISAGKWGKHKTVWQIVAIIVLLLGLSVQYDLLGPDYAKIEEFKIGFRIIAQAVGYGVGLITVASGAMYFVEHKSLLGRSM